MTDHASLLRQIPYVEGQLSSVALPSGEGAERSSLNAPSPQNSEHDAQHEATVKPTSPMPAAFPGPASSQEPCTHGSGAVQDRCESTAPPVSDDLAIPAFLKRGDPQCVVRSQ